jgi:hypothetical protein
MILGRQIPENQFVRTGYTATVAPGVGKLP